MTSHPDQVGSQTFRADVVKTLVDHAQRVVQVGTIW
jgi:hypothetical protein